MKAVLTVLCEAKDLAKYGYNKLRGFLLTHENPKPMEKLIPIEECECNKGKGKEEVEKETNEVSSLVSIAQAFLRCL